ncbi:MAG: 3-phosphoshikimate 1-carboxyvinyltransferase [Lachnospiraceae bacterium]|nr:3-phosphoshikimate 1-carboxyvinyltransferase [Lachnospiraceae bacterium]
MESITIDKIKGPVDVRGNVPGSKSILARAMVFAALSDGKCVIQNAALVEDSRVMMNALRDLGFQVYYNASLKVIRVYGKNGDIPRKEATVYVGSAGTAARFLTSMLACSDGTYTVNASPQLCARPMAGLLSALKTLGVKIKCLGKEGHLPIKIVGRKPRLGVPINLNIDASESTQFVSGMLMTLGCLPNQSTITAAGKTHNSYIDMTISVAKLFGCNIIKDGNTYKVSGTGSYRSADVEAEPDVSSACYLYSVPMLLGGKATVDGVMASSIQGDMQFLKLMETMGAKIVTGEDGQISLVNDKGNLPKGDLTIDMADFSDQVATVAVLASVRKGNTKITNIGHIKKQESNRVLTVCDNLEECGIKCNRGKDYIVIEGGTAKGGVIDPHRDHRIAMAFSILGLYTGKMTIKDCGCVDKSFVGFYDELAKIAEAHTES